MTASSNTTPATRSPRPGEPATIAASTKPTTSASAASVGPRAGARGAREGAGGRRAGGGAGGGRRQRRGRRPSPPPPVRAAGGGAGGGRALASLPLASRRNTIRLHHPHRLRPLGHDQVRRLH